jgi:arylsulfatase A-like enzyme
VDRAALTRILGSILLAATVLSACSPADRRPTSAQLREAVSGSDLWVVLIDAAAAEHFSFYGYERETTPELAALADESIVFERAYAQASATPLSVYSLMTSRYPHMSGPTPAQPELAAMIGPQLPTLASRLAPVFPARGAILANQWISRRLGFDTGFTHFDEAFADPSLAEGQIAPAELIAEYTRAWWSQSSGRRFTYTHFIEPHEPYTPPEPYRSKFGPEYRGHTDGTRATLEEWKTETPSEDFIRNTVALYDGNLAYVDAQIGGLIEELKAKGRWKSTTMVLLSDHGEAFWQHGERGHGAHVYEEYVRVPLLLHLPSATGIAPQRVTRVVELVDLVPTLVDLYGVPAAPSSMAGRSLLPLLSRDQPDTLGRPDDLAFFRNHDGARVELGVRHEDAKYHHFYQRRPDELYDLRSDPGEQHDLLAAGSRVPAGISPTRQSQGLLRRLQAWVRGESGVADGEGGAVAAELDSLSPEARARLKALGYFE